MNNELTFVIKLNLDLSWFSLCVAKVLDYSIYKYLLL
jgi:hypothetical protein